MPALAEGGTSGGGSGETRLCVLASASPRRLQILVAHGIAPLVMPAGTAAEPPLDSQLSVEELPQAAIVSAQAKLADVLAQLKKLDTPPASKLFVLAADTVVFCEGIMGKPGDHAEAVSMLQRLRGRSHLVCTGVAWAALPEAQTGSFAELSTVTFGDYDQAEIERFIAEEPPFDKAGSYAAQGSWARHITHIEGSRENVIGLPWERLLAECAALLTECS